MNLLSQFVHSVQGSLLAQKNSVLNSIFNFRRADRLLTDAGLKTGPQKPVRLLRYRCKVALLLNWLFIFFVEAHQLFVVPGAASPTVPYPGYSIARYQTSGVRMV